VEEPAASSGRGERWVRPLALVGAAVACAAVAIAAAGEPLRGASARSSRLPTAPWLLALPLLALFVVGVVALASLRQGGRARGGDRRPRWLVTLGLLGASLLFLFWLKPGHVKEDQRPRPLKVGPAAHAPRRGSTPWPIWLAVGAGSALAVAGLASRRRVRPAAPASPRPADLARQALADSAADLSTGDPRQGVIAAYARLLEGLRDVGAGRRRAEAPFEFLARALRDLGVREAPLRDLTTLFDEARFSTHPITEAHRTRALAALDEARIDLTRVAELCV
jgi:hypothetical protein